ncbi:MAG: hypothetical protein ABI325_08430, partial [Ginsengibacter sp.]
FDRYGNTYNYIKVKTVKWQQLAIRKYFKCPLRTALTTNTAELQPNPRIIYSHPRVYSLALTSFNI